RTGTAISIVGPKDVGHLYMLRLTYKIRPIERMLPTTGELRTRAEADMIAFLADAYASRTQDPVHLAVARRLLTYDNAEVIIAGLLADHLGASSTQDAADARRAKNPPPIQREAEDEGPGRAKGEAAGRPGRQERRERPTARQDGPRTLRDGERPDPRQAAEARTGGERGREPRDRD